MQTPFPLGFNDNIYHEGNISKMPDFDVLTLLGSRKRKSRSHGIRKICNDKRKRCAAMKMNTSLNDLAAKLREHGRHSMLSYLSSLPITVLRSLDTEANIFDDRNNQTHHAALLTGCYTQHALRPFIVSKSNHIRHFIKIPFINKGIYCIVLPSNSKFYPSLRSSKMIAAMKTNKTHTYTHTQSQIRHTQRKREKMTESLK